MQKWRCRLTYNSDKCDQIYGSFYICWRIGFPYQEKRRRGHSSTPSLRFTYGRRSAFLLFRTQVFFIFIYLYPMCHSSRQKRRAHLCLFCECLNNSFEGKRKNPSNRKVVDWRDCLCLLPRPANISPARG